jgi:hypothetical protein
MLGFVVATSPGDANPLFAGFAAGMARALGTDTNLRIDTVDGLPPSLAIRLVRERDGLLDHQVGAASRNDVHVVAYGLPDHGDQTALPQTILAAYEKDGLDGLATIFGCFGAVIVDGKRSEVIALGDGVGQRAVRYARRNGGLLISSHDLLLAAAGVAPNPAEAAVLSLIQLGWSFGDTSLLADAVTVSPEQAAIFDAAHDVRIALHPAHQRALDRRNRGEAVETLRHEIFDGVCDFVRSKHAPGHPLDVELTAGFDSRAVISLAAGVAHDDARPFTDGPSDAQDTRVAAAVSKALGLPHVGGKTQPNTPESRLWTVAHLACTTNGQASALVGMTAAAKPLAERDESLAGDGGETFRGYYYPKLGRGVRDPFDSAKLASLMLGKFRLGDGLLSDAQRQTLLAHMEQRIARLAPLCRQHSDALDLMYLMERTGVWNQKLQRNSLAAKRFMVFGARGPTFSFLALPDLRGRQSHLHERLFRRFASQTLWIPLNGETIPYLLAGGPIRRRLSHLVTFAAKVLWKLRDKLGYSGRGDTGRGDLEEVRARNFREHLERDWAPLFGAQSVARAAIGDAALDPILAEARAGRKPGYEVAAYLVVMESFYAAARAAQG